MQLLFRFSDDVDDVSRNNNAITLDIKNWKPLIFRVKTPKIADAIQALKGDGVAIADLINLIQFPNDKHEAHEIINYYIERFSRGRLLSWRIVDGEIELAKIYSLSKDYKPRCDEPPKKKLALSRFSYMRRMDNLIILESSLTRARVTFTSQGMSKFVQVLDSAENNNNNELSQIFWKLGFFDLESANETESEKCWGFQDLMLHEASRKNRDSINIGATYRFEGKFDAPPAIKSPMTGDIIRLDLPDANKIAHSSKTLDQIQESRHSIRSYSETEFPINLLGEFLWRVCRTKATIPSKKQELMSRPYPAGGSINELEFYIAAERCEGLSPAIYYYNAIMHNLNKIEGSTNISRRVIDDSCNAMGLPRDQTRPHSTVIITTRLPRLAWKYEGIPYRLTLLHAGVAIQMMYLVATDMGLAPCANGTGDSRLFQEATGINPFEETSIGEFCLGMPSK